MGREVTGGQTEVIMLMLNESGNYDITENYADEIDVPMYATEQDMYAAKLEEVRRIIQRDVRT